MLNIFKKNRQPEEYPTSPYIESLAELLKEAHILLKGTNVFQNKGYQQYILSNIESYINVKGKNKPLLNHTVLPLNFIEGALELLVEEVLDFITSEPHKIVGLQQWYANAETTLYPVINCEQLFIRRSELTQKHGLILGMTGSGKTIAIQREIDYILENTDGQVIVLDNDGCYETFCEKHNGTFVEICPDVVIPELENILQARLVVLSVYRLFGRKEALEVSKATLERFYRGLKPKANRWLYLDELYRLTLDTEFMGKLEALSIVTSATYKAEELIREGDIQSNSYIRVMEQTISVQKELADYLALDEDMLKPQRRYMSVAIIEGKALIVGPN